MTTYNSNYVYKINKQWKLANPPLMTKSEIALIVKTIEENKDQIKTAVELGCYTGGTSVFISKYISKEAKFFVVDSFVINGESVREIAKKSFKKHPNIQLIEKTTNQAALEFNGPIDFLLIDADHQDHSIIEDLKNWLPKCGPKAIVAFHDYFNEDFPSVRRRVEEFTQGFEFVGQADTLMIKRAP